MTETTTCPQCRQPLNLPESYLGQEVQCPRCQHMFVAEAHRDGLQAGTPAATSVTKPQALAGPDDEADGRGYDDDDRDDYPRRRRRWLEPHRASTIMTMGILSIFLVPLLFGTMAWVMGNTDLKKMDDGVMDPEGMSQTRTGRTIGMVMVLIHLGAIILTFAGMFLFFVFVIVMRGMRAG
jgi:hypothetical protein